MYRYRDFLGVQFGPQTFRWSSPKPQTPSPAVAFSREHVLPGVCPAAGSPCWSSMPSQAGVDQLARLLEHLLPSIYGIENFLPGTQLHLYALKVLIGAKQQSF